MFQPSPGGEVGNFQYDLSSVELPWKPTPPWTEDVLHFLTSSPPGTDLTIIALLLVKPVRYYVACTE
jgi:hypothetical protein